MKFWKNLRVAKSNPRKKLLISKFAKINPKENDKFREFLSSRKFLPRKFVPIKYVKCSTAYFEHLVAYLKILPRIWNARPCNWNIRPRIGNVWLSVSNVWIISDWLLKLFLPFVFFVVFSRADCQAFQYRPFLKRYSKHSVAYSKTIDRLFEIVGRLHKSI